MNWRWRDVQIGGSRSLLACISCDATAVNETNALRRNGWQETFEAPRRFRCGRCAASDATGPRAGHATGAVTSAMNAAGVGGVGPRRALAGERASTADRPIRTPYGPKTPSIVSIEPSVGRVLDDVPEAAWPDMPGGERKGR